MPSFQLTAKAKVEADRLRLKFRFGNPTESEALLFDGLWKLDAASQLVADPQQAYRFVRSQDKVFSVRVGACPLPRKFTPLYSILPYATVVPAGGEHTATMEFDLPATEYSAYHGASVEEKVEEVAVATVELMVQCCPLTPELEIATAPIDKNRTQLMNPAAMKKSWLRISIPQTLPVMEIQAGFERPASL